MRLFLTTSLAFITALGLSSCLSSDDQTLPITIYVNVENPSGLSGLTGGQTVSLISSTGYNYIAQTDADGTATFTNVIPDIYNVSASWSITSDQYMEATGETVQHGTYVLSGALANQVLIDDATRLTLSTNCSVPTAHASSRYSSARSIMRGARTTTTRTTSLDASWNFTTIVTNLSM